MEEHLLKRSSDGLESLTIKLEKSEPFGTKLNWMENVYTFSFRFWLIFALFQKYGYMFLCKNSIKGYEEMFPQDSEVCLTSSASDCSDCRDEAAM